MHTNRNSGPNWIHGTGDNPISTIADSTKTTVEDFHENQVIFSRDGNPLDDELATKASEFVWTTIDEAFEYSNTYKDSISPTRSLFDFFKEQLEKGLILVPWRKRRVLSMAGYGVRMLGIRWRSRV